MVSGQKMTLEFKVQGLRFRRQGSSSWSPWSRLHRQTRSACECQCSAHPQCWREPTRSCHSLLGGSGGKKTVIPIINPLTTSHDPPTSLQGLGFQLCEQFTTMSCRPPEKIHQTLFVLDPQHITALFTLNPKP